MPKRQDIESILIIGAGPIVIGQACEFDYSGTQACRVLRAEGLRYREIAEALDIGRGRVVQRATVDPQPAFDEWSKVARVVDLASAKMQTVADAAAIEGLRLRDASARQDTDHVVPAGIGGQSRPSFCDSFTAVAPFG